MFKFRFVNWCTVFVLSAGYYDSIASLELNLKDEYSSVPTCPSLAVDESLNSTWLGSVEMWSNSIWDKQDLLKVLKISLTEEEFAKMKETDLQETCFVYPGIQNEKPFEILAFRHRIQNWEPVPIPIRTGVFNWVHKKNFCAAVHIVMTDNSSYYLGMNHWKDGSLGYYVATPIGSKIDPKDLETIYKKVASLGFTRKSAWACQNNPQELKLEL